MIDSLSGFRTTTLEDAQHIFERVRALREYTERTGFHTTLSQNDILEALPGPVLAEVLVKLQAVSRG